MVRSLELEARQGLVDRHAGPAGVGEDDLDPVVDQALHQDVGPRHCGVLVVHRGMFPGINNRKAFGIQYIRKASPGSKAKRGKFGV